VVAAAPAQVPLGLPAQLLRAGQGQPLAGWVADRADLVAMTRSSGYGAGARLISSFAERLAVLRQPRRAEADAVGRAVA
jgi:hypothetical protein